MSIIVYEQHDNIYRLTGLLSLMLSVSSGYSVWFCGERTRKVSLIDEEFSIPLHSFSLDDLKRDLL